MTDLEQRLRDHLDRNTDAVPGGPDLDRSLRDGRRRRRTRTLGVATATATAAVLGAVVVTGLGGSGDDDRGAAVDRATQPTDHVPGTDVDERFAAVVAEHLPALPEPDDVYPSDSDTRGALPDSEFARATEWQATYTVAPGHRLLVLMGYPVAGEDPADTCDPPWIPKSDCDVEPKPGGGLTVTQRYTTDDGFTYFTSDVGPDGFRVNVLDTLPTQDSVAAAEDRVDERRVRDLVADPRLRFDR